MFKAGPRRVRQPQVSPAAVERFKLTSLVLPGLSNFDYVSKDRLGSVSATPTRIVGPHGKQLLTNASQEAIYGTATGRQKGSGAAASIVWVGELFAAPDAYASLGGITYDASNSNPYVFLEVKRNFASNNLFLSHSVGGSAANITNSGAYTTGWVVIVAAVTSGRQVMYSRSATVRERVSGTTTGSMSSTATSRLEIGEALNARNPMAACAMQAMSSVAWSDATMERILANPWQVAAPLPRRIWVPVSAGGGPDGNASTTPATSTLTAPTATGSGSAQASAAPAGSTLTAPTATATGTAAGHATATGAPGGLTLTAPTATASASAQASGALAGATLTAPTGTASSAGHAIASGAAAGLTMTAPTASATGSAQAFAAFMATVLTAPTATASNGESAVLGSLSGSQRRTGPTRSNRQTATRSNRQTATR